MALDIATCVYNCLQYAQICTKSIDSEKRNRVFHHSTEHHRNWKNRRQNYYIHSFINPLILMAMLNRKNGWKRICTCCRFMVCTLIDWVTSIDIWHIDIIRWMQNARWHIHWYGNVCLNRKKKHLFLAPQRFATLAYHINLWICPVAGKKIQRKIRKFAF